MIKRLQMQKIETVDVSPENSATNRSWKELSAAKSLTSRQRDVERTELEKLMAKQEAKQFLRYRQIQIEHEREEIKLRPPIEGLKLQPREDELRLQQLEQELENLRKKQGQTRNKDF